MNVKKENNRLHDIFQKSGTLREFKKGERVFEKGGAATEVFFIEKGLLKICQLAYSGQNVTFFIRKTGEYFGVAEVILGQPHPCDAQCLHSSQIWIMPSSVIKEKIQSDPQVNMEVLHTLTGRLMQQEYMVEQLISKSVSARLAWLLHQLSRQNQNAPIPFSLTHEEMSNIVGCSRQTISELFNEWRSRGIIYYTRGTLEIIRPDTLVEYI